MGKKTDYQKQYRKLKDERSAVMNRMSLLEQMKKDQADLINNFREQLKDNGITPNGNYILEKEDK